jgi:hypothetical protein
VRKASNQSSRVTLRGELVKAVATMPRGLKPAPSSPMNFRRTGAERWTERVLAPTTQKDAPFGIGIMLDPFDPATPREKLFDGFDVGFALLRLQKDFGRKHLIAPPSLPIDPR